MQPSTAVVLHGSQLSDGPPAASDDLSLSIFSTRRPRDLAAGTSSALKSVTKGVLAGVAGLVAAPVIGAQSDGVQGFFTGLGVGLVGAIALPVAGAAVGVAQIARGAYNSGEAASEAALGKVWSNERRQWEFFSLRAEAMEVLTAPRAGEGARTVDPAAAGGGAGASSGARVAETDLYDVLGVEPTASSAQIKKAYYMLARQLHPDKNPNNPAAKEDFQRVGEAYQCLSNDELRAKYDRCGKEALASTPLLDSSTFFAILFGSEQFEPFVGELQLAMLFGMDGGQLSEAQLAFRQRKREVVCALRLAQLVAMHVHGDESEFIADAHEQAARLAKGSFGDVLLYTIGCAYEGKAAEYFGDGPFAPLSTRLAKLRAHTHTASSAFKLAQAGVRTYSVFKKIEHSIDQSKRGKADAHASLALEVERTGAMALMLESAWRVTVLDIESTLSRVCDKLLQDADVDAAARRRRAEALKVLGGIFCAHGMPDAELDFAAQLKAAMASVESSMMARARAADDAATPGSAAR